MLRSLLLLLALAPAQSCRPAGEDSAASIPETGVLVIDAQKLFIPGEPAYFPKYTPPGEITPVLDNLENLIRFADRKDLPLFVTYELSDRGDSALADRLARAMPADHSQSFIKSYFNATAHPEFARMIRDSGVKRLVVGGAETDVCVLQTVLGLLQMGIEVNLLRDSVFTNEFNYEPALLRMEQAGARLITFADLEKPSLKDEQAEAMRGGVVRQGRRRALSIRPGEVALVAMDVLGEAIDRTVDSDREATLQRMSQALLAGYVFDVPLFLCDDPSIGKGLPEGFRIVAGDVNHLVRTPASDPGTPGLTEALRAGGIEQVLLFGVNLENSVPLTARQLASEGFDTFLMEDAILSDLDRSQTRRDLPGLYGSGIIPLTYKSFYYGMTKAADRQDWPSREWPRRMQELNERGAGLIRIYDLLPSPATGQTGLVTFGLNRSDSFSEETQPVRKPAAPRLELRTHHVYCIPREKIPTGMTGFSYEDSVGTHACGLFAVFGRKCS